MAATRTVLTSVTSLGRTVAETVFAPLVERDVTPLVVDVGARNGMFLLPGAYTERAALLGFEPNPVEYQKLASGTTDAERLMRSAGIETQHFKSIRFEPYAVWDTNGPQDFFITTGAGACSMMGETLPITRDMHYLYPGNDPRRARSLYDLHFRIKDTEKVECRRLDDLVRDDETVDFLKIDVEGGELAVLRGSERLLSEGRVLFLRSEFQVARYYADHPLLCEQHRFLDAHGYRMIDLELNHPRYRQGPFDVPDENGKGLMMAGDAFFIRDPDRAQMSPLNLHRLGIVCLIFWYTSLGLRLLDQAGLLDRATMAAVTDAVSATSMRGWKGRLVQRWADLPFAAMRLLGRLRR